jgi:hypothetical protein
MNKKQYETPEMEVLEIKTTLICASDIEELAPAMQDFDEEELIDFGEQNFFKF